MAFGGKKGGERKFDEATPGIPHYLSQKLKELTAPSHLQRSWPQAMRRRGEVMDWTAC